MITTSTIQLGLALAFFVPLQDSCQNQGSRLVHRQVDPGPYMRDLAAAPHPIWRLETPAHREAATRSGFRTGRVRDIPRRLIRYRRTGLWAQPVAVAKTLRLAFVYDFTEHRCR